MSKPNLLLLHGAVGAKVQFAPLIAHLEDIFQVHTLDFEGHGTALLKERAFSIEHFAENVLDYLNENDLERINIFGHSMGGYVGLYLANIQPNRVHKVFTLGTKLAWSPEIAAREAGFLDADKMLEKVPQFAHILEKRHTASGWKQVLAKSKEMTMAMGEIQPLSIDNLEQIPLEVRIGVGDRDNLVTLEECLQAYRTLPNGQLQVFPATPHPLEKVSLPYLAQALVTFFG